MKALCTGNRNRAFIDAEHAADYSISAAVKVCQSCPILRQCAADALHSGSTLDSSYTRPASAVVQAGVVCRGDGDTARALAEIAGVEVPRYRTKKRRTAPPRQCTNCHRPMVPWTREDVPEGYVMHRGRGICTKCRAAYQEDMERRGRLRHGLHKQIDRGRRHAVNRPELEAVEGADAEVVPEAVVPVRA